MQRVKTISHAMFGTATAPQRRVQPSYDFDSTFDPSLHKVDGVGLSHFQYSLQNLFLSMFSTISHGAQHAIFWLAAAINIVSAEDQFILDSDSHGCHAYIETSAVTIPHDSASVVPSEPQEQQAALQCSRESAVYTGDSVMLKDGTVWLVKQPAVDIWNKHPCVFAAKV